MTTPSPAPAQWLLEGENLTRTYRSPASRPWRRGNQRTALDTVSVQLAPGGRLGIVGESGAGKSTLLRLLLGLERPDSGAVRYNGRAVVGRDLGWFRRDVQVVLQDPRGSLNPRLRVRDIVAEPLECLHIRGDHDVRVKELLEAVGLEPDHRDRYPHEFSGGQRQRIAIARALAPRPRVLIGDEPFSALDATVRADIIGVLESLIAELDLALVIVSHDVAVVSRLCDHIAVMRSGQVVEQGATPSVLSTPTHPYTRELLAAIPRLPD